MSEIITLQAGHKSNFIGTHWWNLQESAFCYDVSATNIPEVNPRITFREGITRNGEPTFTPRVVCIDLKGSLKTLPEQGSLYGKLSSEKQNLIWDGQTAVHAEETQEKNQFLQDLESQDVGLSLSAVLHHLNFDNETYHFNFQNVCDEDKDICSNKKSEMKVEKVYDLDDSVDVWSDFLRVHLHSKSLYVIKEHQYDLNDDSFGVFGNGKEIFASENHHDELEDRIRYFAEECDLLQGFHVLMDAHDGFAGLGSSLVEYLREEYTKNTIFAIPTLLPNPSETQSESRIVNSLLCYDSLVDHASLFSPVSVYRDVGRRIRDPVYVPGTSYKSDLLYHSSGLLAVALDTVTSSYRLRTPTAGMSDLNEMTLQGRKACALSVNFNYEMDNHHSTLTLNSLTPQVQSLEGDLQWITFRGHTNKIIRDKTAAGKSNHEVIEDKMTEQLKVLYPHSYSRVSIVADQHKFTPPFPSIFDSKGGEMPPRVVAGLHTCNEMHNYFGQLTQDAVRSYKSVAGKFSEVGLEREEYIEALHKIKSLSESFSKS